MAGGAETFGAEVASHYEAWYGTRRGCRADAEEKHLLGRLLAGFPSARSVLEVGCGTGHFTRWMRRRGLCAVGLDRANAMLVEARRLDGFPVARGDAVHLPFATNAFDLVTFITTLEFLEQPRDALAEAVRVAGQGLVVGALSRCSPLGLWRRLVGWWRPTVYRAAHFFRVAELARLLQDVAGEDAALQWERGLYPRGWPRALSHGAGAGFIGVALHIAREGC